jgi:hypothetical protein
MKSHKKKIEILFSTNQSKDIHQKITNQVWLKLFRRLVCGTRIVVDVRGCLLNLSNEITKQ